MFQTSNISSSGEVLYKQLTVFTLRMILYHSYRVSD